VVDTAFKLLLISWICFSWSVLSSVV